MNRSHSCTFFTTLFCHGAGGGEQSLVQVRWQLSGCTDWVRLPQHAEKGVFGPAGLLAALCRADYCGVLAYTKENLS